MTHLAHRHGFYSFTPDKAWCGHKFEGKDKRIMTVRQLKRYPDKCEACVAKCAAVSAPKGMKGAK